MKTVIPQRFTVVKSTNSYLIDIDADNYIKRVEAADQQGLELECKLAINNFVLGLKQDGLWNSIQHMCIISGARTLSGALIPLKGTAPTSTRFISSDYNRRTGLKSNGNSNGALPSFTNKFLDTNVPCSINGPFDALLHGSFYLTEKSTTPAGVYMSTGTDISEPTGMHFIIGYTALNQVFNRVRVYNSFSTTTTQNIHLTGFIGATRSGSSSFFIRGNNITEQIFLVQTSTLPSTTYKLFSEQCLASGCGPYIGGTINSVLARIAFYSLGNDVGSNGLTNLNNRVKSLIDNFNSL